ncbi:TNF receptor-associated factor 2-like isoform X1 [Babylonia areolata]|uniref:TNF receptor-associated factor 2-like isoform X1 n=1 Tax=Babylonia areolata TaxID=304850 RepID=UPI003FD601B5
MAGCLPFALGDIIDYFLPEEPNQGAMATASATNSLETDTVPVPDDRPRLAGYRKEIFTKEEEQRKFSCGFCSKIVREPLQADCGHRFCQNCQKTVEESIQSGERVFCKLCLEEEVPEAESIVDPKKMFPDRGFKREMMSIRAKCPNDMCVWQGTFKDYVKHEVECQHQPLVCELCGDQVSKQKMSQHKTNECPQRVIKCRHCNMDIVFCQKEAHTKDCPKVPENCSQCSKKIPRDKMRKHQTQDCANRLVTCPLEGCGDGREHPQSLFQKHVQNDKEAKHLTWVLSRIGDLEQSVNALMEPSASGGASNTGAEVPQTVDELKRRLDELDRQLQEYVRQGGASSAGGATGGIGGGAGADSGQASGGAEASASTGSSADRVTAMEFKVNSLEPILSVLHGEMNRCIGAIEALEQKLLRETRTSEEFRVKIQQYETTISTMTASLSRQETKLKDMDQRLFSQVQERPDGTLLWRIPNFSQVRKDAVAGTVTNIHSSPFYTGALGYKMCVRLYPNGDGMGKGTHLSLFFSIMRSPHDALLQWPFKQKVYFMLIDQNLKKHIVDAFRSEPTSSSFQKPTTEMNIATGCPMFVQLNKLHQPGHGYLKDDTLFIRVLVETDGIDDHLKQFDPRTMPLQQS